VTSTVFPINALAQRFPDLAPKLGKLKGLFYDLRPIIPAQFRLASPRPPGR